jgi:hypothetical protein
MPNPGDPDYIGITDAAYGYVVDSLDSAAELGTTLVPAYTAYTPTLSGSSSNPTLGSGSSATGYYAQQGKRVWGYGTITFGSSGTNAGSGFYGVVLPVEPINRDVPIGTGFMVDASDEYRLELTALAVATSFWASATSKGVFHVSTGAAAGVLTGATPVGAAAPWAWGAGDIIGFQFDYEAA